MNSTSVNTQQQRLQQILLSAILLTLGGIAQAALFGWMAVDGKVYPIAGAAVGVGTFVICGVAVIRWCQFLTGRMFLQHFAGDVTPHPVNDTTPSDV